MKRSTITRSAHRLAVAAVAGAVVLAPVASVADDAAGSGADLAPQSEGTTTTGPEGEQTPPADEAETPAPGTETPEAPEGDAGTPGDQGEEQPPVVDEDASEDEDGNGDSAEEQPPTKDADSEDAESDADDEVQALEDVIEPDLGLGKYRQPVRVGSTLAEGTFVPAGTTTAGTVLRITESNPDFDEDLVRECTTQADTAVEGDPATFCVFDDQEFPDFPDGPVLPPEVRKKVAAAPLSVVFPENPDEDQDDQAYAAQRGSTVTVETVSLPDGLVADPEAAVVAPCPELDDDVDFPPPNELRCTRQVALVEATGLPPVAQDDTATTQEDEPVVIDVLANDDPVAGAPIVDADLATLPENGEVRRLGTGAETRFEYTPADGFSGTDTFGYGFVTPNGVAFADVTVTVEAAPEPAPIVPISNERAQLPDAGGPSQGLLGIAGALVAAGAVALGLGRRRGAEQH